MTTGIPSRCDSPRTPSGETNSFPRVWIHFFWGTSRGEAPRAGGAGGLAPSWTTSGRERVTSAEKGIGVESAWALKAHPTHASSRVRVRNGWRWQRAEWFKLGMVAWRE